MSQLLSIKRLIVAQYPFLIPIAVMSLPLARYRSINQFNYQTLINVTTFASYYSQLGALLQKADYQHYLVIAAKISDEFHYAS